MYSYMIIVTKRELEWGGCDDEEGWIITGKHGTIFVPCFLIFLKN